MTKNKLCKILRESIIANNFVTGSKIKSPSASEKSITQTGVTADSQLLNGNTLEIVRFVLE